MTGRDGRPGYVLVSGDFVESGGMDRANYALASFLIRRGDAVHLVGHRADPGLLARSNVVFHRVPKPLNSYLLGEPFLQRIGRRWAGRLASSGSRVVVNGGNCDWGDVNWVHYVHAAWDPRPGRGLARRVKQSVSRRLALSVERLSLRRARIVVANSERTRAALIDGLGLPPDRVHTIYYGTDPARFRPATAAERAEARDRHGWRDDRPVIAFVGALSDERKGLDTLLSAWRRLRETGWDARLVVIGAGASLARHRRESLDLGGSVEFLGHRRDVPDLLRGCDALVSPTRYEAYGLNVHESLCCGLPALAARTAGVAERYPSELHDLLIPEPGDPAVLADRLTAWLRNRAGYASAVARFSDRLRLYTWDDMASRIVELVERASGA